MRMDDLLLALINKGGSDLHLRAGLPPAIRLNGHLVPMTEFGNLTPEDAQHVVYEILSPEQKQRFETDPDLRNELDFAYSINGNGRFRFNVHKQRGTVSCVARALASKIPQLRNLNLPESVSKFCDAKKGLALVTGPTGSGKSTTLAAIVDKINESRADHILTIEDPVEYVHNSKKSYVTQREVGLAGDTISFKNALRAALRQDPDVILIGEMRDYETIGIAVTSAETGHLVFGTLHTNSAAQTIGRIIDVFPTDEQEQIKTQLGGNLFGVLAQILLPKKDGKGRVCACEIMFSNSAIRNNIRTNSIDAIYQSIQTGQKEGMVTMDMSIMKHVISGAVAPETVRPHLRDESSRRTLQEYIDANPEPRAAMGGMSAHNAPSATPPQSPQTPSVAAVAATAQQTAPAMQPDPAAGGGMKRAIGSLMSVPPWEKK